MPEDTGSDEFEGFWQDVRAPSTGEPRPGDPPKFAGSPNDLVIGTSRQRVLVRISADGTLTYGPEYTPDEAAVTFWEAMAKRRVQAEDRLLLFAHMERLISRVGAADLHTERMRLRAALEGATEHDHYQADMAMRNLEVLMHQVIELGRGLALRPGVGLSGASEPTPAQRLPAEGPTPPPTEPPPNELPDPEPG